MKLFNFKRVSRTVNLGVNGPSVDIRTVNPGPEIVDFGLYHAFLRMVFKLMRIEIVLIQFENQPDLFDHFAATSPFIVLR